MVELLVCEHLSIPGVSRKSRNAQIKGQGELSSCFLFGIIIFGILVGRNTPSVEKTFGEIFRPLTQMGYMSRPCPNMVRKFGILN